MLTRRTILLAPLALAAQTPQSRVRITWLSAPEIPEAFARESVVFPRAYACCPAQGLSRRALETGRFPHAARAQDPTLDGILGAGPELIQVMTAESGNGDDSPSQKSILVPLAIRWPGGLRPHVAAELLISHADVLPTLLALLKGQVKIVPPEGLQGRDRSALIQGREGELPDSIYVEGRLKLQGEWRAVVRGFDKLVLRPGEEATRLYNLADDPGEQNDLAHDREHELTRDSMLALAQQWMRKLGDGIAPSGLRLRN